jgi:hypothetical protein
MIKFYCEPPEDLGGEWRARIEDVVVKGFGAKDDGLWCADRIAFMTYQDEVLAVGSLDWFDYKVDTKGERLWIETLSIPHHPLKRKISFFSLFWEFLWEMMASDFSLASRCKSSGLRSQSEIGSRARVSLLVAHSSPDYQRLLSIYKAKDFEIENKNVILDSQPYTLMSHKNAPFSAARADQEGRPGTAGSPMEMSRQSLRSRVSLSLRESGWKSRFNG